MIFWQLLMASTAGHLDGYLGSFTYASVATLPNLVRHWVSAAAAEVACGHENMMHLVCAAPCARSVAQLVLAQLESQVATGWQQSAAGHTAAYG